MVPSRGKQSVSRCHSSTGFLLRGRVRVGVTARLRVRASVRLRVRVGVGAEVTVRVRLECLRGVARLVGRPDRPGALVRVRVH